MSFFTNEILEKEEVRQCLRENAHLRPQAQEIAALLLEGKPTPPVKPGLLPLMILDELADHALKRHQEQGIPLEITLFTLKDVNIWIENYAAVYGGVGVMVFSWFLNHYLTADLFRLGRLQFQLQKSYDGIPGAWAIEVHIPQGEPLSLEACLDSFDQAKAFFDRFFPQSEPECFMCHSWLLCPNLAHVLDETSNIVRFMRLWTRVSCEPDNSAQSIERVFGFRFDKEQLADAPEHTSLQRRMKPYLLSGGTLDAAAGFRRIRQD